MRYTSFSFAVDLTPEQQQVASCYAGAGRFAYNQALALLNQDYKARKAGSDVAVPYARNALINRFNGWKNSAEAGIDANGVVGLAWRKEVHAGVFEEAVVDLSRGIKNFFEGRKAGRKVGFPQFKKRGRGKMSFRIRHRRNEVRVGVRSITLPKLGEIRVRQCTRSLRRLLRGSKKRPERSELLFATVSCAARRWTVTVNIEAPDLHQAHQYTSPHHEPAYGVDCGLRTLAVCADAAANNVLEYKGYKRLAKRERAKRRLQRCKDRARKDSKNRKRLRTRLQRQQARTTNIRHHHLHNLTSHLVKSHAHLAIEDLHVAGMLKNHCVARTISSAAWATLRSQLVYKAQWRNCHVFVADRFYASSKRCSRCGHKKAKLPLRMRVFHCEACGLILDRDINAAANLAQAAQYGTGEHREPKHLEQKALLCLPRSEPLHQALKVAL